MPLLACFNVQIENYMCDIMRVWELRFSAVGKVRNFTIFPQFEVWQPVGNSGELVFVFGSSFVDESVDDIFHLPPRDSFSPPCATNGAKNVSGERCKSRAGSGSEHVGRYSVSDVLQSTYLNIMLFI